MMNWKKVIHLSQQINLPPIQKLFVIEKLFTGFYYLESLKLTEILQLDCTEINWHFSNLLKLQKEQLLYQATKL